MKEKEFSIGGKDFKGYLIATSTGKAEGQGAWKYYAIYLTTTSEIIAHCVSYEKCIEKESQLQIVTHLDELRNMLPGVMLDARKLKSFLNEYVLPTEDV